MRTRLQRGSNVRRLIALKWIEMLRLSEYDQPAVQLADTVMQRLVKFHYNREFNPQKELPPMGLLHHYTTAEGFAGIIESNELWATSAYFQIDRTEIVYGCGVLKDALDGWFAENPQPATTLSAAVARDLERSFRADLLTVSSHHHIYLVSFCEEGDLFTQWQKYAKPTGYSFSLKVPSDPSAGQGFRPEASVFTTKWVKVNYDRNEQVQRCRTVVDSILKCFDETDTAKAIATIGSHPLFGYSELRKIIADILMEEIVGFKNKSFKDEREWRVVVRARVLMKQGTDDGGRSSPHIHFRRLNGRQVPFVKLIPVKADEKLRMVDVRCGPNVDKATARTAANMLLDTNGFLNVCVEDSDIPVGLTLPLTNDSISK